MAKPKAPAKPTNGPKNGDGSPIRHLYLVDGSGYLFRAYHALPPMTRPDGTPINAVYGFCRMLAANVPAVLFGDVLARKLPLGVIRACAAAAFAVLGVLVLLKADLGLNF